MQRGFRDHCNLLFHFHHLLLNSLRLKVLNQNHYVGKLQYHQYKLWRLYLHWHIQMHLPNRCRQQVCVDLFDQVPKMVRAIVYFVYSIRKLVDLLLCSKHQEFLSIDSQLILVIQPCSHQKHMSICLLTYPQLLKPRLQ